MSSVVAPKTAALLKQKSKATKSLLKSFSFGNSPKYFCFLCIQDRALAQSLRNALEEINVGVVTCHSPSSYPDYKLLKGFDFFVYDNKSQNLNILSYLKEGIVPVVPRKNNFSILKQFDPMQYTGNSFLFDNNSPYTIFASIVSLLENMKYPADKKMLINNVVATVA